MLSRFPRRGLAAVAAALLVGVAGCARSGSSALESGALPVVAAFYPLQFVAERVGGDAVRVTSLTTSGADPHDVELTARQIGQIVDAKLVVYLKGFQPAVDEAVAQEAGDRAFDVATVTPLSEATVGHHHHEGHHEHEGEKTSGKDPHVWLDPTRLATIGVELAERLAAIDASQAADFRARATELESELTALDQEYSTRLAHCERRELITSHAAFGYLATRYRLEQISIAGLTPEDEPSAQRLAEVAEEARRHGATTIFFETAASPKVAETIARTVGATTAVLDPLETAPDSGDYFSVMRANLATLTSALGCS